MGLAFCHNPDWVTSADIPGSVFSSFNTLVVDGYDGTKALTASPDHSYGTCVTDVLLSDTKRFRIGTRLIVDTEPTTAEVVLGVTGPYIPSTEDTPTIYNPMHLCLVLNVDRSLTVWRGHPTDDLATELVSTAPIALGVWHKLGFKGTISRTSGEFEVWNNFTILRRQNGLATTNLLVPEAGGIHIGLTPATRHGHIYMVDPGTVGQTGLMPRLRVACQRPAVMVDGSTWTGSVTDIDDITPDGDATRLTSELVDDQFLVQMAPMDAAIQVVYGAQDTYIAKMGDYDLDNPQQLIPLMKSGGVLAEGVYHNAPLGYTKRSTMWAADPKTLKPWKTGALDNALSGAKHSA